MKGVDVHLGLKTSLPDFDVYVYITEVQTCPLMVFFIYFDMRTI